MSFYPWIDNANNDNCLADSSFSNDSQRQSGFRGGEPASAIRVNSGLRQANLIAVALMSSLGLKDSSTLNLRSSVETVKSAVDASLINLIKTKSNLISEGNYSVRSAASVGNNTNGQSLSFLFGDSNVANHHGVNLFGIGQVSGRNYQFACGKYADLTFKDGSKGNSQEVLFAVGNGNNTDIGNRSEFAVTGAGSAYIRQRLFIMGKSAASIFTPNVDDFSDNVLTIYGENATTASPKYDFRVINGGTGYLKKGLLLGSSRETITTVSDGELRCNTIILGTQAIKRLYRHSFTVTFAVNQDSYTATFEVLSNVANAVQTLIDLKNFIADYSTTYRITLSVLVDNPAGSILKCMSLINTNVVLTLSDGNTFRDEIVTSISSITDRVKLVV